MSTSKNLRPNGSNPVTKQAWYQQICDDHVRGEPNKNIAERYGITEAGVLQIVKRLGVHVPRRRGRPMGKNQFRRNIERDTQIRESRAKGETLQAIADVHGISRQRVEKITRIGE